MWGWNYFTCIMTYLVLSPEVLTLLGTLFFSKVPTSYQGQPHQPQCPWAVLVVLEGAELNQLGLAGGQAHGQQKSNPLKDPLILITWCVFEAVSSKHCQPIKWVFHDWINFNAFFWLGERQPKKFLISLKKIPWIQVFQTSGSRHLWQCCSHCWPWARAPEKGVVFFSKSNFSTAIGRMLKMTTTKWPSCFVFANQCASQH